MTELEAAALVAMLVNAFPLAKFSEANARVYEDHIRDMDARDAQKAIGELICTSKYLPSVGEIRFEVTRARRERATKRLEAETSKRLRLGDGSDGSRIGPPASAWSATLARMLESASRYRAMSEHWYTSLGKRVQPDPGAQYDQIASEAAAGKDVGDLIQREVIGAR